MTASSEGITNGVSENKDEKAQSDPDKWATKIIESKTETDNDKLLKLF